MDKLISVIVPVYKVEKYISQCIESILAQTYEKIELILVDDGSPDSSGKICDEYAQKDNRIHVIHKENGGVSSARNAGLDYAHGEYIAFVDGDDYIDETMYEKLVDKMGEDIDITFCCFYAKYKEQEIPCLQEIEFLEQLIKKPYDIRVFLSERSIIGFNGGVRPNVAVSIWRSLFRKELIKQGELSFSKEVKLGEDRLFLMEYLNLCKKSALVREPLYYYRREVAESATANLRIEKLGWEHEKAQLFKKYRMIESNAFYNKEEKEFLRMHIGHEHYYTFTTAQLGGNPNYKNELKTYHQHDEVKEIIKTLKFKKLRQTGYTFKEIFQIMLIKRQSWRLYKFLGGAKRK